MQAALPALFLALFHCSYDLRFIAQCSSFRIKFLQQVLEKLFFFAISFFADSDTVL